MIELRVTGMTCGGCVNSVKRAVARAVPGCEPSVDLESGRLHLATTEPDHDAVIQRVVAAIEAAGFGAAVLNS